MREAVYFKDEDYRYSFLSGHYVTLAHLSDRDLARIVAQRIQPLYVSIHCTDEKIRRSLLGIRKSRPILELMHHLKDAGILMHGQIVLCPGINDGSVLEKTIGDLLHLRPELGSVSLIPVGLTDHRDGLPFLQTPTMAWARQIIRIRNRYSLKDDPGWLMCSDEFYLKAQVALPSYREYGGFHQIGNGVGLTRDFVHHAHRIRKKWRPVQFPPGRRFIITGISSSLMMKAVVGYWTRGVPWHHIKIIEVENKFFGSCVTVSGLMAGRDILTSLASAMPFQSSDRILIPSVCLAPDNSSFIDNMTVDELQNRAGIAVDIIAPDPESLYDGLFSSNNFV